MKDNDKWASVGSHSWGDLSVRCINIILTVWHKTRKVFCDILPVISLQCLFFCVIKVSLQLSIFSPITQTRLNCTVKRVCIQNKQNGEWKAMTWDDEFIHGLNEPAWIKGWESQWSGAGTVFQQSNNKLIKYPAVQKSQLSTDYIWYLFCFWTLFFYYICFIQLIFK